MKKQFEYCFADKLNIEEINELGKKGWELCGITFAVLPPKAELRFYFKREMEKDNED